MKIRCTIEVSDVARLYIAQLDGTRGNVKGRGLARRKAVIEHISNYLGRLNEDFRSSHSSKLTEAELRESSLAIEYLKKQGKADGEIRAWLLMQRARLHFGKPINLG